MNDTLKVIRERYSCRDYLDRLVENTKLDTIAQAAVQSPSGKNRQQWHIIVVNNKALIKEMDVSAMEYIASLSDQSTYQRIMSRGGKLFYNAPCMVIVAIKSEPLDAELELIDCGIVAQNISLAATSLGIANVHCKLAEYAFEGERGEEYKKRLQIPDGYKLGMAVLLGYANKEGKPHVPDLEKITYVK